VALATNARRAVEVGHQEAQRIAKAARKWAAGRSPHADRPYAIAYIPYYITDAIRIVSLQLNDEMLGSAIVLRK
jgi:hypothetical protein